MPSYMEYEMKNSVMIRKMSGEVRDAYQAQVYELYDADMHTSTPTYKESCARWHWLILVYSNNMEEVSEYLEIIEAAYMSEMDLDEELGWKQMMRLFLSIEFKKTMHSFTQVPRLAILNQTPLREGGKEKISRAIFRRR